MNLAVKNIDADTHPFEVLAGFTAPGVVDGLRHPHQWPRRDLDEPDREPPTPMAATFVLSIVTAARRRSSGWTAR